MDSLRRVWVRCMRRAMHPFPLLMGPPGRGCVCVYVSKRREGKKKEVGTHFMRQSQRKTSFLRGSSLDFVRVDGGKCNRDSVFPQLTLGALDSVLSSKDFLKRHCTCLSCKYGARIKQNNYAVHYVPSLVRNYEL